MKQRELYLHCNRSSRFRLYEKRQSGARMCFKRIQLGLDRALSPTVAGCRAGEVRSRYMRIRVSCREVATLFRKLYTAAVDGTGSGKSEL